MTETEYILLVNREAYATAETALRHVMKSGGIDWEEHVKMLRTLARARLALDDILNEIVEVEE